MKKLSFISIAMLTVILAISSAFTTNNEFYAPNRWERFGVNPNAIDSNPSVPGATSVLAQRIIDGFRAVFTTPHENINTEINSYNSDHPFPQAQVQCALDAENMCAVIISYRDNPAYELSLVSFNLGDYSLM